MCRKHSLFGGHCFALAFTRARGLSSLLNFCGISEVTDVTEFCVCTPVRASTKSTLKPPLKPLFPSGTVFRPLPQSMLHHTVQCTNTCVTRVARVSSHTWPYLNPNQNQSPNQATKPNANQTEPTNQPRGPPAHHPSTTEYACADDFSRSVHSTYTRARATFLTHAHTLDRCGPTQPATRSPSR